MKLLADAFIVVNFSRFYTFCGMVLELEATGDAPTRDDHGLSRIAAACELGTRPDWSKEW